MQARGACASFVFGFVTFMSIGGFPSFVEDMKVLSFVFPVNIYKMEDQSEQKTDFLS